MQRGNGYAGPLACNAPAAEVSLLSAWVHAVVVRGENRIEGSVEWISEQTAVGSRAGVSPL